MKLAVTTGTGISVCGASACSAAAAAIDAEDHELTMAISIVSLFCIPLILVQPLIAKALGLNDNTAGAWIGGTIDLTGGVVASAAMFSKEAEETAAIVKMTQNAALGFVTLALAFWATTARLDEKLPSGEKTPDSPSSTPSCG